MIKDIPGWEDYYCISDDGIVFSKDRTSKNGRKFKGRKLKSIKKQNGYRSVTLALSNIKKQFSVHTLVLMTFVGERPEGMECCHNDGDRSNNNLSNLRWDTRKSNHKDKHSHGTRQSNERSGVCKYSNKTIFEIRNSKLTKKEIKQKYGISNTHLYRVLNGESRDLNYEDDIS